MLDIPSHLHEAYLKTAEYLKDAELVELSEVAWYF
jgi:hypothetical protein